MTIDQLVNIGFTLVLAEMMVAIGLGVTFAEVVGVGRNWRLVARAALANYVCVPAAAVGLLWWFDAHPLVAAGFLIAAVCPGAPYGPPFTAMARGNVAVAVGLMVILAGSSVFLAPLLLYVLLGSMSGSEPMTVDAGKMAGTLLLAQLFPLGVGLAVRQWRPSLAARLKKPADRISLVANLLAVGTIVVLQFEMLEQIRLVGWLGMLALVLAALAAGCLLGGPAQDQRTAMAMTTSVRNVGLSMVIATGSFPGTPAVTAALAFAFLQTVAMALLALAWGRLAFASSGAGPAPSIQVSSQPEKVEIL